MRLATLMRLMPTFSNSRLRDCEPIRFALMPGRSHARRFSRCEMGHGFRLTRPKSTVPANSVTFFQARTAAGVLDPNSREVARMMNHLEDAQFLADGWFDYPANMNQADWFDLGGFSKVQPYYTRNCEIDALRDDVKPFIRSYFNTLAAMLNPEVLTLWEHFHFTGAWDKTHETGYFLYQ